ncbi:hypothetical protein [Paenibacillus methanolicus]|uniref:Uncharacterized protein n=1 Tax=Paenibacillus methanolicus TaxID=582686 RepID=A0A5S5BV24_9BACL|nr:hypothetical protein [Paenibacillus methanolicus]TYP70178.1 hypothetical protein BCM02_112158 [Paenibacillus methanolicus]
MDHQSLLDWEREHRAMKRTEDGFWRCFKRWREENREDYLRTFSGKLYDEFITVDNRSITLQYSFNRDEAFVLCTVNLLYVEQPIGTYAIEFFLQGAVADDFLAFEDGLLQDRMLKIKHQLRTARIALREGMDVETASRIAELPLSCVHVLKEKYVR